MMSIEGEREVEPLDTGVAGDGEEIEQSDDYDADVNDAGDEDDLGDGDDQHSPADELPSDEQREAERPVSRAQARVEAALAEAKAAREEAAAARREIEATRTQSTSYAEQERERVALENMSYEERLQYTFEKNNRNTQARFDQLTFQMADSADRTDFTAKAARMPALALVADEVEQALAAMRASGTTAPRETIAKYLLGERALARGSGAKTRATKAGTARIERAAAKPSGARSDVRTDGPRGDTAAARRARLQDMPI
jgi:hypothetical protein